MLLRGVGTDIVDVRRFARLVERDSFTIRWFTPRESEHCMADPHPAFAFASVFAAKEAAWKALRITWTGGVPWGSMEVVTRPDGWTVKLEGDVARAARDAGVAEVMVSTSVDAHMAVAHAIALAGSCQPTSDAR